MRRLIVASTLFLAACATRPTPVVVEQPQPQPVTPSEHVRSNLLGLTANELVGHLGHPALQIREGNSLKLQFRGRQCVLDAYLYPQNGALRVTHVDTRTPMGIDTDQATCIFALENPS